jgi:hypothetical protein
MFGKTFGPRRLTATFVCLIANAGHSRCSKEDDKKPSKDFTSFLNGLGDKDGGMFEKVREAATSLNGNKEIDFKSLFDSSNVRKVFESGTPGEVHK